MFEALCSSGGMWRAQRPREKGKEWEREKKEKKGERIEEEEGRK